MDMLHWEFRLGTSVHELSLWTFCSGGLSFWASVWSLSLENFHLAVATCNLSLETFRLGFRLRTVPWNLTLVTLTLEGFALASCLEIVTLGRPLWIFRVEMFTLEF